MADVVIRDMEADDRPAVLDIIALTMTEEDIEWARETLGHYFLDDRPSSPNRIPKYYVAVSEGKVVGMSGYYFHEQHYWLGWFAVHPQYQRRGIGSALLHRAEEEVLRFGTREFYVLTSYLPQFTRARGFYRRKGFTQKHRADKRRYGDDALIISKAYQPSPP